MSRMRIFVVGVPRSGTTLVQSILNAHNNIIGFPESHFYRFLCNKNKLLRAFVSKRAHSNLFQYCDELNKMLEIPFNCPKAFFAKSQNQYFINYLDSIADYFGKSHWSEKTPFHLNFIPFIQENVKNCRFIHVIRDPYDTVASLYEASNKYPKVWGARNINKCCARWNHDVQLSLKYIEDKNHYFVRYDNINGSNLSYIQRIFDFLELSFTGFEITETAVGMNSIITKAEPWKNNNAKGLIETVKTDKFKQIFNDHQAKEVKSLIDEQLQNLILEL